MSGSPYPELPIHPRVVVTRPVAWYSPVLAPVRSVSCARRYLFKGLQSIICALRARAIYLCQLLFAQTHALGRYLEIFVFRHHFEPALNSELVGRKELDRLVGARGAHVGEILALGGIHRHFLALRSVADGLPFIHFGRGSDVKKSTLLEIPERIAQSLARCHRYHGAHDTLLYLPRIGMEADDA